MDNIIKGATRKQIKDNLFEVRKFTNSQEKLTISKFCYVHI